MRIFVISLLSATLCLASSLPASASRGHHERARTERSTIFDEKIAELAKKHRIPERLIHRVIMRESRYAPGAVHAGNYGLMQIRIGTARTMGYAGTAEGLRDGVTNLTYAVPYLANAYAVAGQDEDRAVRLYASGFYYLAKRQNMLARLGKGEAPEVPQVVAFAPAPPVNPIAALFGALTAPAQVAVDAAQAESSAAQAAMQASAANAGNGDDEFDDVPLPPHRPRAFSTRAFLKLAMRQDAAANPEDLRGSETQ